MEKDKYHNCSTSEVLECNRLLLTWYGENKRVMPWRDLAGSINQQQHGYCVLVSEVMLQQTQVVTVIPYYKRWMKRWPTLMLLSESNLEEVQQMWKGLGYYSRGRRLLELSKQITCKMGGKLPESVESLMSLPGIGRYTAGAVASIAFGRRTPAVDGNVQRVICRLRGIGGCIASSLVLKAVWKAADSLVPPEKPGDWNQAIMELGAKVCSPRNPSCHVCPLRRMCHAYMKRSHDIEECHLCLPPSILDPTPVDYPRKSQKKPARNDCEVTCVLTADDQKSCFVVKRDSSGLLADLWQFPSFSTDILKESQYERMAKNLLRMHCGATTKLNCRFLGKVTHKFSHINMSYEVVHVNLCEEMKLQPPPGCCNAEWVTIGDFDSLPVSTAMRKVFKLFQDHDHGTGGKTKTAKRNKRKRESP